jgi:aarF domain-containing kinase
MSASIFAALEGAAARVEGLGLSGLDVALAWSVAGMPARVLTVADGSATFKTCSDNEDPPDDACTFIFSTESVFVDAMRNPGRARTTYHLASGGLKLKGNPRRLQDPELRPLLEAIQSAVADAPRDAPPTPPSSRGQPTISIAGVESVVDGASGEYYTAYLIELTSGMRGSEPTVVARKRYSDFVRLDSSVRKLVPHAALAPLPPKRLFHSESVIEERKTYLTAFLRSVFACEPLMGIEAGSVAVARFLGVTDAQWASTVLDTTEPRTPGTQQDVASHTPGPIAQLSPPAFSGRTDVAEEEIEELQQRVDELEATVAQLKSRESSRDALECRAKADSILSLGWKCFTWSAGALALYGLLHGTSARIAWASLTTLSVGAVYMKRSKGMLRRMIYGFWVAGVLYFNYRMLRVKTAAMTAAGTMSEAESEMAWDDCHKVHAIFMYESIVELQGWWVKAGQYLSSRADVMPTPYLSQLSKLQDSIPARPIEEVTKTITEELPSKLAQKILAGLDQEALAAASIAQVHKVKLAPEKAAGEQRVVALKVQHHGVDRVMMQDMWQMDILIRIVAYFEPENDFRPVVKEWTAEAVKELDFRTEAVNLKRARQAVIDENGALDVTIPAVWDEFTTKRVMVMDFCEGFPIKRVADLDENHVDRKTLLHAVTTAFAHQIFVDGCFNADPHPGNILVQCSDNPQKDGSEREAKAVLLDFGLAKTLLDSERLGFAKIVYAAQHSDYQLLLEGFEQIGLILNRENPMRDMQGIQLLMSDTQAASNSRALYRRYGDAAKLRRKARKKVQNANKDKDKDKDKDKQKSLERKNPVDAWPGSLMFFFRTTGLLRGLCSTLDVQQKYLSIMADKAERALKQRFPEVVASPPPLLYASHSDNTVSAVGAKHINAALETALCEVLEDLHSSGALVGAQVCVYHQGHMCASVCCGTLGKVDPRPVRQDTLLNCFSVTKGVVCTALHMLLERAGKSLSYTDKVASIWPAFACNGKEATTIKHVLCHQSGLQHALPDKLALKELADFDYCVKHIETCQPIWPPEDERTAYHYFTFGWLVGELMRRLDSHQNTQNEASKVGRDVNRIVADEIAAKLGCDTEFMIGVDANEYETLENTGRLAILSSSMVAGRNAADAAEIEELIKGVEDEAKKTEEDGEVKGGVLPKLKSEAAAVSALVASLKGREYLADPRIFNDKTLRQAVVPAANGHFSARSLAKFYALLANGGELDGTRSSM